MNDFGVREDQVAGHAPFNVVNGQANSPWLVICDHASAEVPAGLNGLGLPPARFEEHIAVDIGAGEVSRALASALSCSAVLCGTSRLVIDCNRLLNDPTLIPEISDGIAIPGNQGLDPGERQRRHERYFQPYHSEISRRLGEIEGRAQTPAIVSIHSFTPSMNGHDRPWHVGVLWDQDADQGPRMIAPNLIENLRQNRDLLVGDNEPYSGSDPLGYALKTYGHERGIVMAVLEVRQDLLVNRDACRDWAKLIATAVRPLFENTASYRPGEA